MANVAKINGYDVKDAVARGDIADIQQDLSTAQGDITTLQGDVSDTKADLGDITALDTTVKTSAVNAINEVNGKAEDNADNIGTLANLTTTAKTDLVSAINELDSHADTNTANFAPAFSDVISYAVGDYVTYNGTLYKCITAHTAGVWVAGHFTQVTVGSDLNYTNPKVEQITTNEVSLTIVKQGRIVIFNGVFTNQVAQGQDIYINLNDMYMPISNIICGVVHENQGGIAAGNSLVSMAKISNFNNQARVEMYSYSAIQVGASISGSYICAN